MMRSDREQVERLSAELCDGEAGPEQLAQLEAILRDDPAARRFYLRYVFLHANLTCRGRQRRLADLLCEQMPASSAGNCDEHPQHAAAGWQRMSMLVMAAAVVLLASALVAILLGVVPLPQRSATTDRTAGALGASTGQAAEGVQYGPYALVATLLDGQSVRRLGSDEPIQAGSGLQNETMKLAGGAARMYLHNGVLVGLRGRTSFHLESQNCINLFEGELTATASKKDSNFVVKTPGVHITDAHGHFVVHVHENSETEVRVHQGEVLVRPIPRLPRHFWTFDEGGEQVVDLVGDAHGMMMGSAMPTQGLIGKGAALFDNSMQPGAKGVHLGNGGGTDIGTGSFAATTGITIEAMIVSNWTARGHSTGETFVDYDEIFRKEDRGSYRMLLCFQNDSGAGWPVVPPVPRGPSLAFGLYLAEHGYSELEMPIDGLDGRPSLDQLRDGKPHHIVATYDSHTGVKAIYYDGELLHSGRFPPGATLICGGAAQAVIGSATFGEMFNGVIDEVAFYDFALTPEQVHQHYQNVQRGLNYFGMTPGTPWNPQHQARAIRIDAGQSMRFSAPDGEPIGAGLSQ